MLAPDLVLRLPGGETLRAGKTEQTLPAPFLIDPLTASVSALATPSGEMQLTDPSIVFLAYSVFDCKILQPKSKFRYNPPPREQINAHDVHVSASF